jgi:hypothetical protein
MLPSQGIAKRLLCFGEVLADVLTRLKFFFVIGVYELGDLAVA